MSLSEKQQLFASMVPRLIDYIYEQGWAVTLGDGYRHPDATFPYPVHPNTMHSKRLAIDLNFFDESGSYVTESKRLQVFGEYWCSLDPACTWGGSDKKDGGHFSMYAKDFDMIY